MSENESGTASTVDTFGTQARSTHVHSGGWPVYRNRRGWPRWYQRWLEAWWIITGRWSLHRAWQAGYDEYVSDQTVREYHVSPLP